MQTPDLPLHYYDTYINNTTTSSSDNTSLAHTPTHSPSPPSFIGIPFSFYASLFLLVSLLSSLPPPLHPCTLHYPHYNILEQPLGEEQQRVLDLASKGENIFFTGKIRHKCKKQTNKQTNKQIIINK
jgi:hypothetical protein